MFFSKAFFVFHFCVVFFFIVCVCFCFVCFYNDTRCNLAAVSSASCNISRSTLYFFSRFCLFVTCRYDLALSREQKNPAGGKMYIQDRMEQYADDIFERLDAGAHIYFCGLKVCVCVCVHVTGDTETGYFRIASQTNLFLGAFEDKMCANADARFALPFLLFWGGGNRP